MAALSILVIAPEHPDLPSVAAEVAAIMQQHEVVPLIGTVRDRDIAAAVQEGPYDAIWFATHGNDHGVLLSDGVLDIAGMGQYVQASGADLCILNTCASESIGLAMIAASTAHLICTIGDVRDSDAQRFGMLLSGALADHVDYRNAYDQVAPLGGKYRYLTAHMRSLHRSDPTAEITEHLFRVGGDVRALRAWMVALVLAVGFLVAAQLIIWERTNTIAQDVAGLKQQALWEQMNRERR